MFLNCLCWSIILEKLAWRQNSKCCCAEFWPVSIIGLSWNFKVYQWINLNESFRHYYIHYGDCVKRFSKNSFESFQRYTKKRFKSKFCMKLHLYRWWENGLVFKIARTIIHQNVLASKYDINISSILTLLKNNLSHF